MMTKRLAITLAVPVLALAVPATLAVAQERMALPEPSQREVFYPVRNDDVVAVHYSQTRAVKLPFAVTRVTVADPKVAGYRMVSDNELYVVGKAIGRTTLMLWHRSGLAYTLPVDVGVDVAPVAAAIGRVFPDEIGVRLETSGAAIILSGQVSNAIVASAIDRIARGSVGAIERQLKGGNTAGQDRGTENELVPVINLLKIRDPQQVMLEVRIAEVSRSLTERLGMNAQGIGGTGTVTWRVGSGFLGTGAGTGGLSINDGATSLGFDLEAERRNGLVRILAEPTLVAMSGTEGSFNVGGRVLIPVAQSSGGTAGTTITLQEREYGVGLKFVPTVLDNGRINLVVSPEVSELSKEGVSAGSGTNATVLPTFTTSRVSTTVQMLEGQSLVIGGLLRNTSASTVKRFPGLGDIPVLGALFRSSEFARNKTELLVVVRPTLVAATEQSPALPTDDVSDPSVLQLMLEGRLEGRSKP